MMDDLLPRDYLLVLRQAPSTGQAQAWAGALMSLQAQTVCLGDAPAPEGVRRLVESDGVVARWFAQHGCDAALVRPDHIVHGVAAQTDGVADLLARAARQIQAVEPAAHPATAPG